MRWAALAGLAALAIIPTPSLAFFDGLPIDRPAELLFFILLIVLAASAPARSAAFSAFGAAGRGAVAAAAVVAVALKLLLVVHGGQTGFIACYHGGDVPAAGCERTFDNPLERFSATRIDPAIDFEGAGWRLGLLNSLRFDAIRRDHAIEPAVAFSVEWTSLADAPSAARVHLRYRGEGRVAIDDRLEILAPDYSASGGERDVEMPAGRHQFAMSYRFAPPIGSAAPEPLRALMHLDAAPLIRWGSATRLDTAAGWVVDLLALGCCGLLIAGLIRHAPRDAAWAGALAAAALLVSFSPIGASARDKAIEVLIVGGGIGWIRTGRPAIPFAALTLALLCIVRVWSGTGPAPGVSLNRLQGNDGLTYESYAHEILDTRSPQGGEPVFTLQMLFRYIRFAERLVFGEADWLLLAGLLIAMNVSYGWLGRRVALVAIRHQPVMLLILAMMLWMMNGASGSIAAPMSEYPTWVLLPVIVGLLFLGRTRRAWFVAAALMGLAVLTRFNQAPAYACLLAVFALAPGHAAARPRWLDVFACGAVMGVLILGFPLAHNSWYGHSWTVLPTNRYSTLVIDLHPGSLVSADWRAAWRMFGWKLAHVTHVGAENASSAFWPLHVLQLAVAVVVVALARRRLRVLPGHAWLAAAPVAALGVHLFYVVHFYYPRHIMFGYLLAGVVALVWIAEDGLAERRREALT